MYLIMPVHVFVCLKHGTCLIGWSFILLKVKTTIKVLVFIKGIRKYNSSHHWQLTIIICYPKTNRRGVFT